MIIHNCYFMGIAKWWLNQFLPLASIHIERRCLESKVSIWPNFLEKPSSLEPLCWRWVVGRVVFSPMLINAHLREKAPNFILLSTCASLVSVSGPSLLSSAVKNHMLSLSLSPMITSIFFYLFKIWPQLLCSRDVGGSNLVEREGLRYLTWYLLYILPVLNQFFSKK